MADSGWALIREARNRIDLLHAQAAPPGMEWEGRSLRLNEAGWLKRLADALEARLDQQDQLQEALNDPDLLHWLGSQDVIDCSSAVARAVTAIHRLRTALVGDGEAAGWTCDHCGTRWPHKPDLPAGTVGCPECGTYVPEGEA